MSTADAPFIRVSGGGLGKACEPRPEDPLPDYWMIPAPDDILVLLPDSSLDRAVLAAAGENELEGDESVDNERWPDARLRLAFRRLQGRINSSDWVQSAWTDQSRSHRELHQEEADAIHWVTFMVVEALYRRLLRPEDEDDAAGGIALSEDETAGPQQTGRPLIHEVFPYLIVRGAAAAIEFYERVFGAEEVFKLAEPSGKVAHAEFRFGPATVMVADEYPEYGLQSPEAFGGTGVRIHLHVDDVDALASRAAEAGATVLMPPTDQSHGERQCPLRDPFGHEWLLGHEIEEVSREEMQRRIAAESGA